MKDSLKVIETKVPEYSDSRYHDDGGYENGYSILEATVNGQTARFKIPAYEDSSGSTQYEWTKITQVEKVKKSIEVWE